MGARVRLWAGGKGEWDGGYMMKGGGRCKLVIYGLGLGYPSSWGQGGSFCPKFRCLKCFLLSHWV